MYPQPLGPQSPRICWQHVTPSLSATQAPYPQFTILLEARDSVTILQPKYVTTWVMGVDTDGILYATVL